METGFLTRHFLYAAFAVAILPVILATHNRSRVLQNQEEKPVVRVVVYDKIRGYLNWLQPWFIEAASTQCSTRCILSEKMLDIDKADVVVFHAPTHGQVTPRRPTQKTKGALYALVSLEQPKYALILNDFRELKHFDLLMTYSLNSHYGQTGIPNMPITYYPLHILSTNAVMQQPRPFKDKNGYQTGIIIHGILEHL
jgi:Fucosyltransferase, N-terminal